MKRFKVTYKINKAELLENQLHEGYLGELHVVDSLTEKEYVIPIRGEENTFNAEFLEQDMIGFATIYFEQFNNLQLTDLKATNDFTDALFLIEDYTEGYPAAEIIQEYLTLEAAILSFYLDGKYEPVILVNENEEWIEQYIKGKEIASLIARAATGITSKNTLLEFAILINSFKSQLPLHESLILLPIIREDLVEKRFTQTEKQLLVTMMKNKFHPQLQVR